MKNKQHKYIFKAFIKSKIPAVIKSQAPDLIIIDSFFGGLCSSVLAHSSIDKNFNLTLSKEEKEIFSKLINESRGIEREELLIYYRLLILVEGILPQYIKKEPKLR